MEIVRARPEETDLLIALFRDYDFALRERRWFDWKHAENPFGTPHVYKLIQDGELAGTVGLLPQPFRYAGRRLTRGAGALQVRRVDRFTEDMDRFQPADRVHGERSAVFLNWCVIDNPRDDLRAFTFHTGDETLGYAVCKVLGDTWEVLELRSLPADPRCAAALLSHLYRVEGAAAADFWLLDGHLQPERLPQGLLDRGRSGAMFVQGHRAAGLPADPTGWAGSFLDSDW
jgi:hypothetical protein